MGYVVVTQGTAAGGMGLRLKRWVESFLDYH